MNKRKQVLSDLRFELTWPLVPGKTAAAYQIRSCGLPHTVHRPDALSSARNMAIGRTGEPREEQSDQKRGAN